MQLFIFSPFIIQIWTSSTLPQDTPTGCRSRTTYGSPDGAWFGFWLYMLKSWGGGLSFQIDGFFKNNSCPSPTGSRYSCKVFWGSIDFQLQAGTFLEGALIFKSTFSRLWIVAPMGRASQSIACKGPQKFLAFGWSLPYTQWTGRLGRLWRGGGMQFPCGRLLLNDFVLEIL